jgi:Pyruvate ferredoxin/flavodoxin oxidoreductase/Glycosyl hydrolase family 3 N terminal domain
MRGVLHHGRVGAVGLCLALLTTLAAAPAAGAPAASSPKASAPAARPWMDASLAPRARAELLLARMTLEEKVGQMTQAERGAVSGDPSLIATWRLGSVLSGGGSTPTPNTPEAWADMVDAFQEQALQTRLGIPLVYGVDSVHGHGNLVGHEPLDSSAGEAPVASNSSASKPSSRVSPLRVSGFQLHFADHDIMTPGDAPTVLVAMNPAALRVNLGDVPKGGTIIVNTDAFTPRNLEKAGYASNPLEDGTLADYHVHAVALTSMTLEALKEFDITKKEAERAKNMFALGLPDPTEHAAALLAGVVAPAPAPAAPLAA